MRKVMFWIFLFVAQSGFAQNKDISLSVGANYGFHTTIFSNYGVLLNSSNFHAGLILHSERVKSYFCLTYLYNTNSFYESQFPGYGLYKGHFLGLKLEHHFINSENRFSPYFGLSLMSEIVSNYEKGYLSGTIEGTYFLPVESYRTGNGFYPNYYNSSGFYYGTPFFGGLSIGCDFRLISGLHLSLGFGLGIKVIRYKYLEWYEYEDYREILKEMPIQSRSLFYANAQLGLRYEFSLKKEK